MTKIVLKGQYCNNGVKTGKYADLAITINNSVDTQWRPVVTVDQNAIEQLDQQATAEWDSWELILALDPQRGWWSAGEYGNNRVVQLNRDGQHCGLN